MTQLPLFLHVLSAFVLFAGIALAAAAQESARRRRAPGEIAALLSLARVGALMVMGGLVAVLAFGLWLVEQRGYSFGDTWLAGAVVLWAVASVLGALGGRRPKRARLLAERLTAEGRGPSHELIELLGDRSSLALSYASTAAVIGIVVLMIWKP
jgi:uncharacterized membrane protein